MAAELKGLFYVAVTYGGAKICEITLLPVGINQLQPFRQDFYRLITMKKMIIYNKNAYLNLTFYCYMCIYVYIYTNICVCVCLLICVVWMQVYNYGCIMKI